MTDFSSNKTTERYRATEKEESGRRVLHCPVLAVENLSVPWPSKSFLQPHKPTIILGDCFQNFSEEQFYRTYKNFFQNLWWQLHCGNPIIRRGFPIQVFTKITAFKISDDFDSSGASMVLKCSFEVLIIVCQIDFINWSIFNCFTLHANLFIFNC